MSNYKCKFISVLSYMKINRTTSCFYLLQLHAWVSTIQASNYNIIIIHTTDKKQQQQQQQQTIVL